KSRLPNGLSLIVCSKGQGKVVLCAGSVLEPAQAANTKQRHQAYSMLCNLVGAKYTSSPGLHPKAPGFGTLALATLGAHSTVLDAAENLPQACEQFASEGCFSSPSRALPSAPTPIGRTIYGAVAKTVVVPAGGTMEVPFLLAWHYPNKYAPHDQPAGEKWMGCHYTTQWTDARGVLREGASNFKSLRSRTDLFNKTFYDSTLPIW